jgi:hypothetical protein
MRCDASALVSDPLTTTDGTCCSHRAMMKLESTLDSGNSMGSTDLMYFSLEIIRE